MSTQTILPIDRDTVISFSQERQEPEWVLNLRLQGLELAASLELPKLDKTRIDRWHIDHYGRNHVSEPLRSFADLPQQAKALLQTDGETRNILIQRNSANVFRSLAEQWSQSGVIFTDLQSAVRDHEQLVRPYLMTAVRKDENRLTALHTALWNGGAFLYVPKNVRIEIPLQALFVADNSASTFAPHILIVAEANSSVTYADNYISAQDGDMTHNGMVEVFVKTGAHVQFASVHQMNGGTTDLTYRRAIVENDGKIDWILGEMNDGNGMSDTTSILRGNGSESDAKVICVGSGEQKLNITTRAIHHGKHTPSRMITRAVMREEATAIINGITKIEKGATKANGEQTEKVLMLSPKARGDANPILLIDEDDVKAGHAASVGQVNPEYMYYLMSRGIPREIAERLIIYGFLAPVVGEIPIARLKEQLQSLVERKLGQ